MHFGSSGFVQELHGALQLGAADDGVVHEEKFLALYQFRHRDHLHLGDLISHLLLLRHEGPGPGRGVFNERPCERLVALIGVAYGMRHAGVGHSRNEIHVGHGAVLHLLARHDLAVAVAHDLNVDPLIVGVGVTVVGPQERADLHLVSGRREDLPAVSCNFQDLGRPQFVRSVIAKLLVREALE